MEKGIKMGTKIIEEQKEKLLINLKMREIPEKVILTMFNIANLDEINVVQYNCLLLILENGVVKDVK